MVQKFHINNSICPSPLATAANSLCAFALLPRTHPFPEPAHRPAVATVAAFEWHEMEGPSPACHAVDVDVVWEVSRLAEAFEAEGQAAGDDDESRQS